MTGPPSRAELREMCAAAARVDHQLQLPWEPSADRVLRGCIANPDLADLALDALRATAA